MSAEPVVDVTDWEVRIVEPGGSDENRWLIDPVSGRQALFKPVVAKHGRRQGEDWAEKVVERVAGHLGVPAARIVMARWNGRPGLLSFDVAPSGFELHTGAVVVGVVDPRLVPRSKDRLGHNLSNIKAVLCPWPAVGMPAGFTAFDQFCGYLMLDALVANRDRHEENWGVLRAPDGALSLAPSYDHGNSLGFNLQDAYRARRLKVDPHLSRWAARGTTNRFEGDGDVSLVGLAREALRSASPGAGRFWMRRFEAVTSATWESAVTGVPEMSDTCRTFCLQVLITNQRRLLSDDIR